MTHLQGYFHQGLEVQTSNSMIIHGNVGWEMTSHCKYTAIYFYMCISHSMTQYQGLSV